MELKLHVQNEVTRNQYAFIIKEYAGFVFHRYDETEKKFYVKIHFPKVAEAIRNNQILKNIK